MIDLSSGQPRRRYSLKLLWSDRQPWFTPQGFSRSPSARLEQFAVNVPDNGPQWAADQIFYQIFLNRLTRSQSREVGQGNVYYHHAAGHGIVRHERDEPLTVQAGGSTSYGGDLNGISERLPYLKTLRVAVLYPNPVFTAPSVYKYDIEDYRHADLQFGGDRALLRLRYNTQQQGMHLILDGVLNHSGDLYTWFDRHDRGTDGACHNPESPWRDWYHFLVDGAVLGWLEYSSLPKLNSSSESLANRAYRGEDSTVRHRLKAPQSMDGWRLDVVYMSGEAGGACNNLQHVAGITQAAKEAQSRTYVMGEYFGDARQWLQADAEDTAMNYRGFTLPLWELLANTGISYDPQPIDVQTCMVWMDNYYAGLPHQ